MARTAGVHTLLADSMERIHRTPTEWMQFLSFHAQFYRYNTSNAALIYAQRPEATACATMNFWNNRLNRWIRRGSHGIRLLQPDGESIRYVFDVADTTGPPGTLPRIWSAAEKELPVFMDYIAAPEGDSVQERIAAVRPGTETNGPDSDMLPGYPKGKHRQAFQLCKGHILPLVAGQNPFLCFGNRPQTRLPQTAIVKIIAFGRVDTLF